MSTAWRQQRERGSVFSLKLIAWLALILGRPVGRILLYPICIYFIIFAHSGRRASYQYLGQLFGRPASLAEVFRHHYTFASTLLDRAFLLAGRHELFATEKHGIEVMYRLIDNRRGALLLGAHLGSFEMIRSFGETSRGLVVNMMMYEENARKVNKVIDSLGGRERMRVIPVGGIDAMLRAKECADRGEMIGILADRAMSDDRVVRVPFLGRHAAFPVGPFLAANSLKIPVVLFFCFYHGGNRYTEHFELFADEISLSRESRQAEIEQWVGRYAARLEHYCRLAPYNWFNFFDFWASAAVSAKPPAARGAA